MELLQSSIRTNKHGGDLFMEFRKPRKSVKKKMKKFDFIDIGMDLVELIYFLTRFIVRSIVKLID